MIIRADKTYETHSKYPGSDWYNDGRTLYVIDEGTTAGRELAVKIRQLFPWYDFILDNGKLVDAVEIPHTEPVPAKTALELLQDKVSELEGRLMVLETR